MLMRLLFVLSLSFVLGFYFNENSIGAGGYDGDLEWMWKNLDIYKSNDLWTSMEFISSSIPLPSVAPDAMT